VLKGKSVILEILTSSDSRNPSDVPFQEKMRAWIRRPAGYLGKKSGYLKGEP
jgi:hypothetical protein